MSASVVRRSDAIDAAFCRAIRSTLVGSMIPASIMSTVWFVSASNPSVGLDAAFTFARILCEPLAGVERNGQVLVLAPRKLPAERPEEQSSDDKPSKGRKVKRGQASSGH